MRPHDPVTDADGLPCRIQGHTFSESYNSSNELMARDGGDFLPDDQFTSPLVDIASANTSHFLSNKDSTLLRLGDWIFSDYKLFAMLDDDRRFRVLRYFFHDTPPSYDR
jgi:hypothetical protein